MQRLFRTKLLSVYRDRDVRKRNIRNRSCPVVIRTFSRSWQRCGERKVYPAILTRHEFSCRRNSFRFYLSRSNIATRICAGRCDGCRSAQRNNHKLVIADQKITRRIKEAGNLLDIQLLDHIILTPEKEIFRSLADEGQL